MRWKVYIPQMFPSSWHRAMLEGVGKDKVVERFYTKPAVLKAQKRFALFRLSLRHHPLHETAMAHEALAHRTRIIFNHGTQRWELLLTSRKHYGDDDEMSQVLQKPLDSD